MLVEPARHAKSLGAPRPFVVRLGLAVVCILLVGSATILLTNSLFEEDAGKAKLALIVAGFALYLFVECWLYLRRTAAFDILNPVFLASILHFFVAYVMSSVVAIHDPWVTDRFASYFVSQSEQMTDAMLLVYLAAFSMWRGYYIGRPLAKVLRRCLSHVCGLRRALQPALLPVLGLQVVYFALVAFSIDNGVFGIASGADARAANASMLDLLRTGMMAGSLALFLLLTYVFQRRADGNCERVLTALCVLLIFLNVLTGALSGFKSQIVMPFVMLAFAKFVAVQRLSLASMLAACLSLVVAYHVIEPYRAYLHSNQTASQAGVGLLLDALQESQEQRSLVVTSSLPLASQIASRFDLMGMSAVGIAFVRGGGYVEKSAEFAESLYLSPILAFVPRAVWPDKPSYSSGVWFNSVVLGKTEDDTTSVGMGPVAWLYLMGGFAGVAIGFVGLGIVQALMFDGVARAGAGGMIIFLGAAMTLVMVPTDVGPAFTGMLRMLPLAFVAQFLLLLPGRGRRTV